MNGIGIQIMYDLFKLHKSITKYFHFIFITFRMYLHSESKLYFTFYAAVLEFRDCACPQSKLNPPTNEIHFSYRWYHCRRKTSKLQKFFLKIEMPIKCKRALIHAIFEYTNCDVSWNSTWNLWNTNLYTVKIY